MCESQRNRITASDIFKHLCRTLTENSDVKRTSAEFTELKSNRDRVDFAYRLLDNYGLFPKIVGNSKNVKLAEDLRMKGNELYKVKNFKRALDLYIQSISHSEPNSDNLILAIANRSHILLIYELYEECLKDISMVFSTNYPEFINEKLQNRKIKAESRLPNQLPRKYHEEPPSLTYGPNNLIECASDCVEIKFGSNLGRHVVATRDIEVGDVIAIEKPFSQILLRENYLTHCYHCLRPCYNLIGCDKCPLALFCGEDCKSASWNTCHKYECPILATLLNLKITKLSLVALKICMLAGKELNKEIDATLKGSTYKSQNYHEIHNLIANTDLRTTSDLFERAVTAAIIFELVQKHTTFFDTEEDEEKKNTFKELLLLHMQTGPSNFHEISELVRSNEKFSEVVEIGAGAYAFLSLLNHSCCPNVVRHCYGSSIVLRALRPIANGEQLLDNYGYHHAVMLKSERQEHLRNQYHFECKCEACENDWPLYHDLSTRHFDITITEEELTKLRNGDIEVATAVLHLQKTAQSLELLRPCRELAEVQEIIKQCYAIFGNKRDAL